MSFDAFDERLYTNKETIIEDFNNSRRGFFSLSEISKMCELIKMGAGVGKIREVFTPDHPEEAQEYYIALSKLYSAISYNIR